MSGLKVGCARGLDRGQDLTAQRNALAALGVQPERVYVDHGPTGTNRARPGLREALAVCRCGDTLGHLDEQLTEVGGIQIIGVDRSQCIDGGPQFAHRHHLPSSSNVRS